MNTSKLRTVALGLPLPIALVIVWWLSTRSGGSFVWSPIPDIVERFRANWMGEHLLTDFWPSLRRILISWTLASLIGIAVGIVLGSFHRLRIGADPLIGFLRSIPSAALVPLALLTFGIGDAGKIFLITFVCVWPVLLNAMDGLDEVNKTMSQTARAFRIPAWRTLLQVRLPSAAPRIATGMRTSLGLAVIVMLTSEMVASTDGVGYFTIQAQRTFRTADMWSGVVLLGLLGIVLNALFNLVERRALRWYHEQRAVA